MMQVLVMIAILAVLILVHEWGHYISAKKMGVKVNEFAIGMGPKLYSKQKGETLYSIRALPIGGFCAMEGETGESAVEGSLQRKKPWQRLVIFAAGAGMNFILAWIMLTGLISYVGYDSTTIAYVEPNMAVAEAGLREGDRIVSVDGVKVKRTQDIIALLDQPDKTYTFVVEKVDGTVETLDIKPTPLEDGSARFGFTAKKLKTNIFVAIWEGLIMTFLVVVQVAGGFLQMITGRVQMDDVAGIVGVVQISSQMWDYAIQYSVMDAVMSMVELGAILSANLAVLNLLPLPALDGGRILFTLIEMLRGKPVDPEKEGMVHFVGFVMLMVLMVVIFYNDIARIVG